MPRARIIRPRFWDSPDTAAASLLARLLYLAMHNWADDYGIGSAVPIQVIGFAFPHDDIPPAQYQPLLDEVAEAFGVVFFRFEDRPYYVIPTWNESQPKERKARPKTELMVAAKEAVTKALADMERPSNVAELPRKHPGSIGDTTGPAAVTP